MNAIAKKIAEDGRVIVHGRPTGRRKGGKLPPEQVRGQLNIRLRPADRDFFIAYGGNASAGIELAAELARREWDARMRGKGGCDGGAA
jgi:hypothetical protein